MLRCVSRGHREEAAVIFCFLITEKLAKSAATQQIINIESFVYHTSTQLEKFKDFMKGLQITDVAGVALETKISTADISPKTGHIRLSSSYGRDVSGMYQMQHT
jgi:hypothetical protein